MFDPYRKWLGIPPEHRPPNAYQLLGIGQEETDAEVIEEAALRQTAHVRAYQIGPHAAECTRILNEIAQAKAILLNPAKRREYDAQIAPKAPQIKTQSAAPAPAFHIAEDEPEVRKPGKKKRSQAKIKSNTMLYTTIGLGGFAILLLVVVVVLATRGPGDPKLPPVLVEGPKKKPLDADLKGGIPPVVPKPPEKKPGIVKLPEPPVKVVIPPPPVQIGNQRKIADGMVTAIAVSSDGKKLYTGGPTHYIEVWNYQTGQSDGRYFLSRGKGTPVSGIAYKADSNELLAGTRTMGGLIYFWSPRPGDNDTPGAGVSTLATRSPIAYMDLAPDQRHLLTLSARSPYLQWWDLATKQVKHSNDAPVLAAKLFRDGQRYLTTASDGMLRVWDSAKGVELKQFEIHKANANLGIRLAVTPDGKVAFWGGANSSVIGIDLENGQEVLAAPSSGRFVLDIDVSDDGKLLAFVNHNRQLFIWDWQQKKHLATIDLEMPEAAKRLTFAPGGNEIVVAGDSGVAIVTWRK